MTMTLTEAITWLTEQYSYQLKKEDPCVGTVITVTTEEGARTFGIKIPTEVALETGVQAVKDLVDGVSQPLTANEA